MTGALIPILASLLLAAPPAAAAAPRPAPAPAHAAVWDTLQKLRAGFQWAAADSVASAFMANTPGLDSLEYSRALGLVGESRLRRRLFSDGKGFDALESCVSMRERLAPKGDDVLARAHWIGATFYTEAGRPERAVAHAEAGLRVLAEAAVPDTAMAAQIWLALATARVAQGRTSDARAAFEQAVFLREAKYGRDNYAIVPAIAEYGVYLSRIGEFDDARVLLMRAVDLAARDPRPGSDLLEGSLGRLSTLEDRVGNLAESVDAAQRSYELARRNEGDDDIATVRARTRLAYRLVEFGDHQGAVAHLEAVIPMMDARMGASNPQTVSARLALVGALIDIGDTARAARELAPLGPILRSQGTLASENGAYFRLLEAELEGKRGHWAAARETLDVAIRLEMTRHDPLGATLSSLYGGEQWTLRGPADRARADSDARAIQRLRDSTHASSVSAEWIPLLSARSGALSRVGEHDGAWATALEAEQLSRERLGYQISALPDRRALQISAQLGGPCELLVALAPPGDERELATAWDRVVRWRGRVGYEVARRRPATFSAADTAVAVAHARWIKAQRKLGQLVVSGTASPRDPATAGQFEAARQAAEDAEQSYVRLASGAVPPPDSVTLERVLARLGDRQALIAFTRGSAEEGDATLGAFVATGRDRRVRHVTIGAPSEVDAVIRAWTSRLAVPPTDADAARRAERDCRTLGLDARKKVWDPVARLIGDAHDVFIVPEGSLFELPWMALPGKGDRYLVEQAFAIHVLNAERDLLPVMGGPAATGLLAVGDPDFDRAGAVATDATPVALLLRSKSLPCSTGTIRLDRLSAARREAEAIAQRWPAGDGPAELLLGGAADEATLKRDAPGRAVIHIATHGVAVVDTCGARASGLRGMAGIEPVSAPRPGVAEPKSSAPVSPWLGRQVWLALAGANRPIAESQDENEGLLTAEEVVTLDLRGTEWVVLSACQSGVAPAWTREGVLGMRRAFHLAGAQSVIASEWAVDDEATREWMSALYVARAGGAGAGAAVRSACQSTLAARCRDGRPTHPFYWAAFSASGRD